ncbi:MAG TPA: hypothetical protein VK923_16815 [Euzebyales bacterium]|nr:hypothetical protein [Euzebyales bacterium]
MVGLETEHDDRFATYEWLTHRVAVVVMTLVVLGGALGVFGFGPLASATRRGEGFTVTYERFARNGAPLRLTIEQFRPGSPRVWIDDAVLEAMQLERVVPAAATERRTAAGVTFGFDGPDTADGTAAFTLTGDDVGMVRGRVGRSPTDAVPIWILLYP